MELKQSNEESLGLRCGYMRAVPKFLTLGRSLDLLPFLTLPMCKEQSEMGKNADEVIVV